MNNYQLLIDTWEGQLEIDEQILRSNGVAGMFIRLNDMRGGHHMDETFTAQWAQAKGFLRAPYFVYNPWVNGPMNFSWLGQHMPDDAKAVAIDIEVRMDGYSPATYAAEVKSFIALARKRWNVIIYTGQGYLSMLSSWVKDVPYWWAQYPNQFYTTARSITWDELRAELAAFNGPSNAAQVPGALKFWQFTGDRLTLPGNKKPMDVNVFFGSYADLEALMGPADTTPPPPPPVVTDPEQPDTEPQVFLAEVLDSYAVNVRKYPQVGEESKTGLFVFGGELFQGRLWAGNGYVWMQIETTSRIELFGLWVAVRKIDGTGKLIKLLPLGVTVPSTDEIPGSHIFQLRDGRDPYLLQKIGLGELNNFGHLHMYSATANNFGDVIFYLHLSDTWKKFLLDIQRTDRTIEKDGKTVLVDRTMQLNWLYDPKEGRPYFNRDGLFSFGACVVPSQPIRIRTDQSGKPIIYPFENVRLRDGIYKKVPMVKIAGFTPDLKDKGVDWLIQHAYIVDWTAISPAGKITKPLGMRQVVWEPDVFRGNGGDMYIPLFYLKGYEL